MGQVGAGVYVGWLVLGGRGVAAGRASGDGMATVGWAVRSRAAW